MFNWLNKQLNQAYNTYFPQDPRCADFDETEITLMLSDIRNVMNKYEFDQLI